VTAVLFDMHFREFVTLLRLSRRRVLLLLLGLFLLVGRLPASALAQETDGPEYIVQPGDSLYSIAIAFGTSVEELQAANDIAEPALLSVGARLLIPGYTGVQGLLTTHSLEIGDSFATLSTRLNVPTDSLIRLNRIVNPSALYLGQPIVFASSEEGDQFGSLGRFVSVGRGDTLASIGVRYGVSTAELIQWNALPASGVYTGQRIFVPGGEAAAIWLPPPIIAMELRPVHPRQGEPVVIIASVAAEGELSGALSEWSLNFIVADDKHFAFQGVHAFAKPGIYPLVVTASGVDGISNIFGLQVPISDAGYEFQAIMLPADQNALLDAVIVNAEIERIAGITSNVSTTRHWTGAFAVPVDSDRITAGFGLRRSYNGGPYSSFHGGLDYGGPSTTPIAATAAGEVVLAERLQVRGNAIIIDHGWGVFSGYWHQSEMTVAQGDFVTAGQQIGMIGSTGLSTGNHLHWEIWVGGNQVNPLAWLGLELP